MLDFLLIDELPKVYGKRKVIEIRPKFIVRKSKHLMIRGGDFYAIWNQEKGFWSTEEEDAIALIDAATKEYYERVSQENEDETYIPKYLWDSDSRMIKVWHQYCQQDLRDNYHPLDEKLLFSNNPTKITDYASKCLSYPLIPCETPGYDGLMSVLYSPEERHKLEWAIGSIVVGDSSKIQKFVVLYGSHGTGKSTILHIIESLFDGYCATFDAKSLGTVSNAFALEAFKTNPLVAIQHDGDLSKIEDNSRLNSLISHEKMTVNEKFKSTYSNAFKAMLFMGTNRPVKITDVRSGLLRRLIDVSPTGNKIPNNEYNRLYEQAKNFELGGIACHCRDIYLENPHYYDDYEPVSMMSITNDFYGYIETNYYEWKKSNRVTLEEAWQLYKVYSEEAKLQFPFSKKIFREELRAYFDDVVTTDTERNVYTGFKTEMLSGKKKSSKKQEPKPWLEFVEQESLFDSEYANCPAQYANEQETPMVKWDSCTTKLMDIDTSKVHYVKTPEQLVVIDFDIPDENGNKSFEKNFAEAVKWPETYAELSKSGQGIHLHYIYDGNIDQLSSVYSEHIEVKVFKGKSSLRRKLSKCNALPIRTLTSGLPLKGRTNMVTTTSIETEAKLRSMIKKALRKEVHSSTKSNIDFIDYILNKAYDEKLAYDVSDMKGAVASFALDSTNQSQKCMDIVSQMKFIGQTEQTYSDSQSDKIVFFDIEVFPNLFLLNWKFRGDDFCTRLINPTKHEIADLLKYRLIGFNNRRYDNHILWHRLAGASNQELFRLSQRLISDDRTALVSAAYNLSYTDVYDFASKKQSLKKWEIELGIRHMEWALPWDQDVPEDKWEALSEYCDNDVFSTEKVFDHLAPDFMARQILADVTGLSVNHTTNELTAALIFGNDRHPQGEFNWRDMSSMDEPLGAYVPNHRDLSLAKQCDQDYVKFDKYGRAVFPGYTYSAGVSYYRGEKVGEGGYAEGVPGMYGNGALLDIASMHPHSAIEEQVFGPRYTPRFMELVNARMAVKHKDWETAGMLLEGKLKPYIEKIQQGLISAKDLAYALKIAINSVYGLTSAKFMNVFRDPRNVDNIVAKRGALFMINLKHEVMDRGFKVAHIKTDSIKIPDATPEIIKFVMDFGAMYGYSFEHEATYDRFTLVNDAVYIARYKNDDGSMGDWTATGTQFAVPYVYKTLFTHEPITFMDKCITCESKSGPLYLVDSMDNAENGKFIGRIGRFVPVNTNGRSLYCKRTDKNNKTSWSSPSGTKGYFYMEAEEFLENEYPDSMIDESSFIQKCDEARMDISQYGDFEWFVSDDPYIGPQFVDGKPLYHDETTY